MSRKKGRTTGASLRRLVAILEIFSGYRNGLTVNDILSHPDIQDFLDMSVSHDSQRKMVQRDFKELLNFDFIESYTGAIANRVKKYQINRSKKSDFAHLLKLDVDDEMLKALLLSQDIFNYFDHTYLKEGMEALGKTINKAYNFADEHNEVISSHIKVKQGPKSIFNKPKADILSDLSYAIDIQSLINIEYQTIGQTHDYPINGIESYQLILHDDNFYLLAYNPSKDAKQRGFRTLNLMRFKNVEIVNKRFELRDTTKIEKKLSNSFGILTSGRAALIKIVFSKKDMSVVKRVLEKVWHHSAKVVEVDNIVELSMYLNMNDELARWILHWGDSVISVEPKSMRTILNNISKAKW